jgi:hypothetical protein
VSATGTFEALITPDCVTFLDNDPPDGNATGGVFELIDLVLGRYTIQEVSPPPGYTGNLTRIETVELNLSAPDFEITVPWENWPPSEGCTPGFWQNPFSRLWWNIASDPDWNPMWGNPFYHETEFNSFFTSWPSLDGLDMWDLIRWNHIDPDSKKDMAVKAARHLAAAYLNAAHSGISYTYGTSELHAMWDAAVAVGTDEAFRDLKNDLEIANELLCPLGRYD